MDKGKWILVAVLFVTMIVAGIVVNVASKKLPAINPSK
jgi:hypothetical protein